MTLVLADRPLWGSTSVDAWRAALAGYDHAIAALPNTRLVALDAWYRHALPVSVAERSPHHLTHDEMVRVTEWKMARGVWRAPNLVLVRKNAPGAVEEATSAASGLLEDLPKALAAVSALHGVGPATASAALAVLSPPRFPFFDEIVAGQVAGLGPVAWTAGFYRKYAAALIARADELGDDWTATLVERALWADGVNAGARV